MSHPLPQSLHVTFMFNTRTTLSNTEVDQLQHFEKASQKMLQKENRCLFVKTENSENIFQEIPNMDSNL